MSLLKSMRRKVTGLALSLVLVCSFVNPVFAETYELSTGTEVMIFAEGITAEDYIEVADGYYLTMTVDGVETVYVPGTAYLGNVVFKIKIGRAHV